MKLRLLVIIAMLSGLALSALAQETAVNSLKLNWGMGNIMRQDFTISPFIHQKWSPVNASVTYERSGKLEQQGTLKFGMYKPMIGEPFSFNSFYNGELTSLPHSFIIFDINWAIGKYIYQNDDWKLVLGGRSKNHIHVSDYMFGESGPSPFFMAFGLDLWLSAKFDLNEKQYLKSGLSLPLFSFIYRPPYLSQDDEYFMNLYSHKPVKEFTNRIADAQLQSWGASQSFDFDISYGYSLSERWDIGLMYLLSMNFNQVPTRYAQVENVIYLSGTFKF